VAVLLDNFVTASTLMENEARDQQLRERKSLSQFKNPLEPLVLRLASRCRANLDSRLGGSLQHTMLVAGSPCHDLLLNLWHLTLTALVVLSYVDKADLQKRLQSLYEASGPEMLIPIPSMLLYV
jgi:hypothetical protein